MKRIKRQILKLLFARKIEKMREQRARLIEEVARRKEHCRVKRKQEELQMLTCKLIGWEVL